VDQQEKSKVNSSLIKSVKEKEMQKIRLIILHLPQHIRQKTMFLKTFVKSYLEHL